MFLNKDGITISVPKTEVQHYLSNGFKKVKAVETSKKQDNPLLVLSKAELIAYAEEKGYKINKSCGEKKLIEAILAAEAEGKENKSSEDDPEKTE